jgi:ectoine hydroxylase-related dioxygenase (phytanoyl-CoA dioxygenase family)
MTKEEGLRAVQSRQIHMQPVPLEVGDVLIRHPWALHRGTPNTTDTPRALASIRYVPRWYTDSSRETQEIPQAVWHSLTPEQRAIMRFPIGA